MCPVLPISDPMSSKIADSATHKKSSHFEATHAYYQLSILFSGDTIDAHAQAVDGSPQMKGRGLLRCALPHHTVPQCIQHAKPRRWLTRCLPIARQAYDAHSVCTHGAIGDHVTVPSQPCRARCCCTQLAPAVLRSAGVRVRYTCHCRRQRTTKSNLQTVSPPSFAMEP
jgi:hypothetical protein